MSNQKKFDEIHGRTLGGIPGKAAREGVRVADDKDIADLPARILNQPVPWYGFDGKAQPKEGRTTTTLAAFLGWIDSGLNTLMRGIADTKASVDGLNAAVKALSEKQGIDPAELERLISEAVTKSAGKYELRRVED